MRMLRYLVKYLSNKLSNVYKDINVATNETIFGLFFGQRTFVESKILNILSLARSEFIISNFE